MEKLTLPLDLVGAPRRADVRARERHTTDRALFLNLLSAIRPEQWTKNLVVFAGLIFGQRLFEVRALLLAVGAFAVFCGLSGVVYLVNDVMDRESDRRHPLKSRRAIASGALSVRAAVTAAATLGALCLGAAWWLDTRFGAIATGYLVLLSWYSGPLKRMVIVDVLAIAIGFVLRAVAGAVVIPVPISQWLLVCTILLALFLALSKRRHELVLLADGATGHRPILAEYSPYLLDQMISVVTASLVTAYIFYAISAETAEKFHTASFGLTIPFPLYGIFRYLYLVHQKKEGGSPAAMLTNDRPLLICVVLWVAAATLMIYRPFTG
jgi:4-hydroxybenzoate polyprenyltransferase